jgi:O-antigen ligase
MNPVSLAAWAAAFFLCAALFSHTVALRLFLLLLGVVLASAGILKQRRMLKVLPSIWLPFLLWGAWAALSISWSLDPARSAKEFQNEIVYCALALWFCFVSAQAADAERSIVPVFACGAVSVCSMSLYYLFAGGDYSVGWHGGAGAHSSALLTVMPCALAATWYAARSSWPAALKALPPVLVVLCFLSAYATLNRTVWIGFALQFLLIGGWALQRSGRVTVGRFSLRRRSAAAIAGIAVIAATAILVQKTQTVRAVLDHNAEVQNDPRPALWASILDAIKDRPLTGYGFGRGMLRQTFQGDFHNRSLWHSHNLVLDILLQLGIPGLLLFVALLAVTVREGWNALRDPEDAAAVSGIALIAVVAGMLVRNMTDVLLVRQNALLFWGVVGVLLAWAGKHRLRHTPQG